MAYGNLLYLCIDVCSKPSCSKMDIYSSFSIFLRQAKCDILWSYRLFKNNKEMRNRIWHLIFIEDSTGHKRKTNKKSGDKDERLLDIMPYATMTEITSLNSTIPNSIEFMLYVVRTQLFFFFYPFPYILEVYYIYFDRFTPDWQPVT